jgi:MFS family permease
MLEPVFVRDVLNQPVTTFALLQTAFGVGLVGTGTALPSLRRYMESTSRMGPVIFTAGVAAAIYAATPVLSVTFAASAAWGVCVALFSAPSRTLLLQQTPADAHGRVLGAWQSANSLGQLLPALAFPVLAGIGTQASLVGCGALLAVVGLAAWVAYPRSPGHPNVNRPPHLRDVLARERHCLVSPDGPHTARRSRTCCARRAANRSCSAVELVPVNAPPSTS